MIGEGFPSDPSRRRVLIVVNKVDLMQSMINGDTEGLYNNQTHLVQFPIEEQGENRILERLDRKRLIGPGVILVQSPYDVDDYAEATDALEVFALQKHYHFSTLCMHLGAKTVMVEQVDKYYKKKKTSKRVEGGNIVASGDIAQCEEEENGFLGRINLFDEFDGTAPDVDLAEKFLINKGLIGDQCMLSLLEMRRNTNNPIKERKLVLNLSSEATKSVEFAARLRLPKTIKMSADYEQELCEKRSYELTVRVKF